MPTPKLQQVADAMSAGNRSKARELLMPILANDLRNVDALLWMAAASDTADERQKWLNRVLELDPKNKHAIRGLEVLGIAYQPSQEQGQVIAQPTDEPPSPEWEPVVAQPATSAAPKKHRNLRTPMVAVVLVVLIVLVLFSASLSGGSMSSGSSAPSPRETTVTKTQPLPQTQCPMAKKQPPPEPPSQAECQAFTDWYRKSESNISALKFYAPIIKAIDYNNLNISQIKEWSVDLEAYAVAQDNIAYVTDDYIGDVQWTLYSSLAEPAGGMREFLFVNERAQAWGQTWAQEHMANGIRLINEGMSCVQPTFDYINDRLARCK